jgi:hypothetical protein
VRAHVVITHSDGSTDVRTFEGERATLGKSLHATIPVLGAPELEDEHLLLAPRREGCWVGVRTDVAVPAAIDGAPIGDGLLPWGTTISLGRVKLTLRRGDARAVTLGPGASRLRVLAMVIGILCCAMMLAGRARGVIADGESELAPSPLFDAPVACDAAAEDAREQGRIAAEHAVARGERFYFDFQDGIHAVALYDRAVQCLRAAGDAESAARVEVARTALATRIDGVYLRLRLRLAQARRAPDDERALATLHQLRELTRHRDDPYTRSLGDQERELAVRLGVIDAR